MIAQARPDVLLVTELDWDAGNTALTAFQTLLADAGAGMPHAFAFRPNTGLATGLDLDGDGKMNGARDAQGYGRFRAIAAWQFCRGCRSAPMTRGIFRRCFGATFRVRASRR